MILRLGPRFCDIKLVKRHTHYLDFVAIDGSDKQFIFINPNDPEYKMPDESLDTNTTHDF